MPVNFIQAKKKQKYFILVFLLILVVMGLVLWLGYFKEKKVTVVGRVPVPRTIDIDFEFLESQAFKDLRLFESISLPIGIATSDYLPGSQGTPSSGRENPFLPYSRRTATP